MNKFIKDFYKKLKILHNIHIKHKSLFKKKTYSMEGEDLVILENLKNINCGIYVDVGCYHPTHLNNTLLLFKKGWRGINIDLSEYTIDLFNYSRPKDLNINSAIADYNGEICFFYQKTLSQLTTVKKEVAIKRMQGEIKQKKIKALRLDTILENSNFKNQKIDFLNIDVEGADLEVLKSINLRISSPLIICVEIDEPDIFNSEIHKYLINYGYKKIWSSKSNISHIFCKN